MFRSLHATTFYERYFSVHPSAGISERSDETIPHVVGAVTSAKSKRAYKRKGLKENGKDGSRVHP